MDQKEMFKSVLLNILTKNVEGLKMDNSAKEEITKNLTDALSRLFDLIIGFVLERKTEPALTLLYSLVSDLIIVKLMDNTDNNEVTPGELINQSLNELQGIIVNKVEALSEAYKTLEENQTVH